MGTVLAVLFYFTIAALLGRVFWRVLLVLRSTVHEETSPPVKSSAVIFFKSMADIALLRRVFRSNQGLWAGEWVFHVSFIVILVEHLRFFLNQVPAWVTFIGPAGKVIGYIFGAALCYIFIYRIAVERGKAVSGYNLFLLVDVFFIALTGVLMRTVARVDLVSVKVFILGLLMFSPRAAPPYAVFYAHFLLVMAFVFFLPSHVFTAPHIIAEARKREEGVGLLIHEGKN